MTYLDARRPRPRHVDHEAGGTRKSSRAPHGHGSLHVPATKLILLTCSFFRSSFLSFILRLCVKLAGCAARGDGKLTLASGKAELR